MMPRPRLDVLISPGFVLGLALLLANDFVLKDAWPGFVTGKLSDFAGLCAFALFWSALLPRWAGKAHLVIAAAWVVWKSPAATAGIDAWNAAMPLQVARVIDYGDLAALAVLPLSYAYFGRLRDRPAARSLVRRSAAVVAMACAAFAFGATSYVTDDVRYTREDSGVYHFYEPAGAIINRFNAMELDYNGQQLDPDLGEDFEDSYWIAVPSELCGTHFEVRIEIRTLYETDIELQKLRERCNEEAENDDYIREFERSIITPLARSQPTVSPDLQVKRRFVFDESDATEYTFNVSREELITRIEERIELPEDADDLDRPSSKLTSVGYWLGVPSTLCGPFIRAFVQLTIVDATSSRLTLKRIHPECREVEQAKNEYRLEFERDVIEPLRAP